MASMMNSSRNAHILKIIAIHRRIVDQRMGGGILINDIPEIHNSSKKSDFWIEGHEEHLNTAAATISVYDADKEVATLE